MAPPSHSLFRLSALAIALTISLSVVAAPLSDDPPVTPPVTPPAAEPAKPDPAAPPNPEPAAAPQTPEPTPSEAAPDRPTGKPRRIHVIEDKFHEFSGTIHEEFGDTIVIESAGKPRTFQR